MAALYLVRHGQASFGTHDYDRLSNLGVRQAQQAGRYLRARAGRAARIVSGSLVRHRDTAAEIARCQTALQAVAAPVQFDERFNEVDLECLITHLVPSLHDADGTVATLLSEASTSRSSYQKLVKRVFIHWQTLSEPVHSLESWSMFASRVSAALADLISTSRSGETTIVVTSGGVIAALVQQMLALPAQSAYGFLEAQMNCSMTCLLHDRQRASLSSFFNESAYLTRMDTSDEDATRLLTYR